MSDRRLPAAPLPRANFPLGARLLAAVFLALLIGCGSGSTGTLLPAPPYGAVEGCAPVDIVFVMDVSGSMFDEAQALCRAIDEVEARLRARGAPLAGVTVLGITEGPNWESRLVFPCLTGSVADAYGIAVPGSPPPQVATIQGREDWGPATAIVAARHAWADGAVRVVVPVSDEGPRGGEPCDAAGDDGASIEHAIQIARANGVVVSPIAGTGSDACVFGLQRYLARQTGGRAFISQQPEQDMTRFLLSLIEGACDDVQVPCDGTEQLAVFDDSDVLDDQFDVFVDGQLVFRTPVGGGAVNDTCLAGFGPGRHTLRIVFVQDIDDPEGTDPDQNGTYGVLLSNGVTFEDGPGVVTATSATADLFPPGAADEYEILVP